MWDGSIVCGKLGGQFCQLGFILIYKFIVQQPQRARLHHLTQHGLGDRLAHAVVVNVDVQAIHQVEMRVASKQLAHRGIANPGVYRACGKRRII